MLGIELAIEPFRLNDIKGILDDEMKLKKKSKRKEEDSFDRKS